MDVFTNEELMNMKPMCVCVQTPLLYSIPVTLQMNNGAPNVYSQQTITVGPQRTMCQSS